MDIIMIHLRRLFREQRVHITGSESGIRGAVPCSSVKIVVPYTDGHTGDTLPNDVGNLKEDCGEIPTAIIVNIFHKLPQTKSLWILLKKLSDFVGDFNVLHDVSGHGTKSRFSKDNSTSHVQDISLPSYQLRVHRVNDKLEITVLGLAMEDRKPKVLPKVSTGIELAEDGKDGYNGVTVLGISFSQQGGVTEPNWYVAFQIRSIPTLGDEAQKSGVMDCKYLRFGEHFLTKGDNLGAHLMLVFLVEHRVKSTRSRGFKGLEGFYGYVDLRVP
ncbi:hypothetical protein FXO38_35175 [Capsicum annuum]|nr:hypothetical protein FXO38_35175 [Capsicum annuum]